MIFGWTKIWNKSVGAQGTTKSRVTSSLFDDLDGIVKLELGSARTMVAAEEFQSGIISRSVSKSKMSRFLSVVGGGTAVISSLVSCVSDFQGEYSDPSAVEIVDDRWNETDARKTAEELIKSMLSRPWLANHKSRHKGNRPVVIVDEVENRTDEHLDVKALMEATRDELINSGSIRFVNASRRKKILEEIRYQNDSGMVAKKSTKKRGRQTGADFLLGGAISSSVHTMKGLKTVTYQINMILTDLETSEIVWSKKHLIKKRFKRSGSGW